MSSNREQLQVPGHPDYLPDLREFANRVGAKHHLAKKLVNTFKLAIDEAATNIIKHAYRNYQNSITIQAVVRRKTVTFILIDQGAFFDPSWADEPDPTYAAELGQRPPLGIFMLRKLIDKIEYARTDAGNELRLTKNRKSGQGVGSRLKYPVYFAVALTAITIALLFYLRASVDEELRTAYYHSGKRLVQQVTEKIKQIKPDLVASDEGRLYVKAQLQPTYENHIWEVYSLALVDTTGRILWSTKTAQINQPFVRPESTHITGGIFAYPLDGIEVYEFEQRLSSENHDGFSGTVHVFLSQNYLAGQIAFQKLAYLKKAAVSLAISYLLIALLGYLIQNHFGKIPRFIKELFNRFTFDPIQQPVSIDNEADEDFLKVIERLNAEKVPRSLPPVDSTKAEPPQDPPKPLDASSRQVENSESLNPPLDVSSRQGHENPSGREQPTLLLSQPARNSQSLKDEKDRPENPKHGHPDTALPALNLRKFLDFMNEEREVASLCGVNIGNPTDESVPPEDLAETDAACEQKRSTEKSATSSDSDSETLAAESESAPEIAPDKQGFDVDDISDSLVDDLFNNYVGKIETSSSKRHEKDSGDSKRDTDGARKPRSTRKKKTPETEGRKPTEPAPVNTHDAPGLLNSETEIEAKSLLVESISDLLANIKKPDSPEIIAPEGAPLAPGEPETEAMVEQVPDEASRRLDRQEKDSVCDPLDFMNTGISNYRGKRYEDAIIAFKNVLKIVPENRDALVLLGNSYYRNNMTKEALATYETLKKKYPDESIAHENLGLIYAEQGLHQLAIKEWKTVLNLNPHRTDLMEKINLAANRKRDSAGTDIDTQSRRKKDDSQRIKEKQSGLLEQGIAFYRNRDFDKAIQVFESLIETYPAFEEAYGFLGITYFRSNRLREAKAVFQKLQPFKRENASTHENLGLIYAKEGSFDLALEEWKKALALTPHRSDIKEKINQVSQLI